MPRPLRLKHITFAAFEEARRSAQAAGFRTLKQAAKACGVSMRQAVLNRPWEYAELVEEDFILESNSYPWG